ncbi:MAG TPA: phosphatidylglycerol lysyltransferase domain-containing protein, partial [Bacillota bacterium]|nr:phosphatidylglycerol lysyltransferase domain-containing protein [Bacillota bacterium]
PELATECLHLQTEWFNLIQTEDQDVSEENEAMQLVLANFEALQVIGGVIKVDGKISALAVGEELNKITAVIHIEKANTEIDGMFPAINQQFAANCWSGYEFINREEDMGLEGLRKAKLSYNPVRLVEKFSVGGK